MCSPSWTLLPPPSPYHPSGSSQCTSPKHPVLCSNFPLIFSFTCWLDCVAELLHRASLIAQLVKNSPAMQETRIQSPGQEDVLEKEMATHSSILAWRIPWTEERGGLQSLGSQSQTWLSDSDSLVSFPVFLLFWFLVSFHVVSDNALWDFSLSKFIDICFVVYHMVYTGEMFHMHIHSAFGGVFFRLLLELMFFGPLFS